jgi:hypothetical protein
MGKNKKDFFDKTADNLKGFSDSIKGFLEGSQGGDTFIIGKPKKYGNAAKEKKSTSKFLSSGAAGGSSLKKYKNGGLVIKGHPKLAKKGWK